MSAVPCQFAALREHEPAHCPLCNPDGWKATPTTTEGPIMTTEPTALRVLTVRQPWAQLIVEGHKDVENRSWSTTYRGPLIIHAGTRWEHGAVERTQSSDALLRRAHDRLGMVVGVVQVTGCHRDIECLSERRGGDTASCSRWAMNDHHHWTLAEAVALDEPVLATGALGLWKPTSRILDAVQGVLDHA